jgi:Rap1a immunity proteins
MKAYDWRPAIQRRRGMKIISSLTALFALTTLALTYNARAEDRRSVEYLLPACRFTALDPAPVKDADWTLALQCRDALATAVKNGRLQPKFLAACVPDSVDMSTVAQSVVAFLERNPERYKERFDIRVASALHDAWPCP